MARVHIPDEYAADPAAWVWGQLSPVVGASAAAYSNAVYQHTSMSLREMEAARMRTAQINGCMLCLGMRAARDLPGHLERSGVDTASAITGRDTDAPDEAFYQRVENWRTAEGFSPRERLVIEYAERLGEQPRSMAEDEDFWQQMHALFTDAEIVDMTFAIGSWMAFGRLTHVLEIDTVCMPTMPS